MSSTPQAPARPKPSRLDRALRYTAATLALSVAILASAEAIARRALDPPIAPYAAHPLFHLVRSPGYKQKKLSIEEPPYWFTFEANPLGFRGKKMQTAKKPADTYRIFFLGASTTENQHLPEEKTFPGIVESRLDAALSGQPRIEVANCGVAGFGIARSLSLIEHRILALEPDLIVLLDVENDLMTSIDERFDPTNALLDNVELDLKEFLAQRSRLFAVLNSKASKREDDTRRAFARRRALARGRPYRVPENVKLDAFLESYKAYVRWVALICRDAGVPVVFMTQPTLWKEKNTKEEVDSMWMSCFPAGQTHLPPDVCCKLMATYNDALKATAAQLGAPVVDLAAAVPRDLLHFSDDAHLTADGNASVADAILATILKDGKLPARAASQRATR